MSSFRSSDEELIIIEDEFEVEEEKPHICLSCDKCFTSRIALDIHEQSHFHDIKLQVLKSSPVDSSESNLSCNICGKTFCKPFSLERHKKIHENKREHQCTQCSKAFNDKSDLKRHERTHSGQKPYKCEVCSVQFTKKGDLTRHRKTHSDVWELNCKFCSKKFYRKDALIAHKKTHLKHNDDEDVVYKFTCSCGLGYNDSIIFESHLVNMGHKKLFTCEECQNVYINSDLLKKHERYHKERMFICGDCDKAFAHSCDLVKHRRIHTGERPFRCIACGRSFVRSTHLKSHIKNIHMKKVHKEKESSLGIGDDENVMVQIEKGNVRIKIEEEEMEVVEANDDNSFLIENAVNIKKEEEEDDDEDFEIIVC